MFPREYRPLKRPRLGVPDFYPQEDKQKEDELTFHTLNIGYRLPLSVDTQDEFGSAVKDFSQHLLNAKEYSHRVNQVMDEKKKRRWVQDSERRKFQVSKENFFPVPLGRNRKEIATQWFQELAGSKPLSQLAKKVPVFNKKEEIFDNLCEKDVPTSRAAWYIKMTAAYSSTMTDLKLNKKKQSTGPSFDWTVSLTKYMQECVWRICNDPNPLARQESQSGGRHPSSSGAQTPSEEGMAELNRWQYMVYLSSWMYEENLLDSHEFLHWLVDRVDHIKSSDNKAIQLYLPLVLKHLLDIGSCVALARPVVKYCCTKLAAFFELEQKLAKFQPQPPTTPAAKSHLEPHAEGATAEDDSVFDSTHSVVKREVKMEPGVSKASSGRKSSAKDRKHTTPLPSTLGDGEVPIITMKMEDNVAPGEGGAGAPSSYFHWCPHHQSLMLQLCCIIQTIAIRCPTAYVQPKVFIGRGMTGRDGGKVVTPLSLLPMGLTELPMPRTLVVELQRKLLPALASAEQEIFQRNKAVESDWSAVTVADLQTTSEGTNVQQTLKLLEVLDTHSFFTSRSYNPLTTLYHRISVVQKSAEQALADEMFAMLLCQWAVSPHRSGVHRPLVVAKVLRQRQDQIIRGADWKDELDKAAMDETWDEFGDTCFNRVSDFPFPFQAVLVRFLDVRAPLPDDLSYPTKTTDPFYHLLLLFSELVHLSVFSYPMYLSTLTARGEIKSPIIPYLPFAREEADGTGIGSRKRLAQDTETLNCSIPLPALKRPHLDAVDSALDRGSQSSLASGPPSPGGSFGPAMGNFMDIFSGGGGSDSGSIFPPDMNEMDESKALFQKRAQQLQMLTSETSRLVSPLEFSPSHTDTDAPSTPATQAKSDPFNFSIFIADDEQIVDPTLDKHASRHLIFAAYFPVCGPAFSKQNRNERAVVLCGVGKMRQRVEAQVKAIANDVEHYFRLLDGIQTPVLPDTKLKELMDRFKSLPNFEQCLVATSCVDILKSSLKRKTPYPACAQLVFVCELLKICGAVRQLLDLLVGVIACDFTMGSKDEPSRGKSQPPSLPPLPEELCLPILWHLHKYLSCLLLSQQDTATVFENLARVFETLQLTEITSCQKAVFLFLHRLFTNCIYIQTTFRSSFGHLCIPLGESFLVESFSPCMTDVEWQKVFLSSVGKPNECNIPKLCAAIKGAHIPKSHFCFAVDVFVTVCQKNVTCQMLCDLARVCAAVSCSCGPKVNKELMGALRALCVPSHIHKHCSSGYTSLTSKNNILIDRGIHGNLITFIALLLANNVFHLHDIITYILRPIIRIQIQPQDAALHPTTPLVVDFINSLILHLFVSDYVGGVANVGPETPIVLPPFVQHCLEARCRDLNLGYVLMLLKDLVKLNPVRSVPKGDAILGHSGSDVGLSKLKSTLELVASQPWVRSGCAQQPPRRLLDSDMLGDKYLGPPQARFLFLLLCPYAINPASLGDLGRLAKTADLSSALEHILKNLDQWTLNNSLLHIEVIISHTTGRTTLLEELAAQVIHVFEDSCGDEWLGQTIECCVDGGDGSFSPSVWLVTPLISKLQEGVLGRVLKSAGNVLGQGQWWNPEKNQEKRRATRATSGVSTPKTGLQWQQPFLELVLACMHAQSATHEELLGPLKNQLSTFLAAFDKEGMPGDEQGKTMLYAALKLRLSLVGSMLGSICVSEATTLEWLHLLMQFITSGSIDRQTDSSELFTNCLDMICTLLQSLSSEFHISLAGWGEEGKKSHTTCIKKLKTELANSKSYCSSEIRQLFPLSQKSYSVITVKTPPSVSFSKGVTSNERIKGLRVQDTKEICPWEILEGVKNSGPLMLSWFGAVRMKRKPLMFEEQRHLVRFHAHQHQFQNIISGPSTVMLPSEESVPMGPPTTIEDKPAEGGAQNDATKTARTVSVTEAMDQGAPTQPHPPGTVATPIVGGGLTPIGPTPTRPQEPYAGIRPPMMQANQQMQQQQQHQHQQQQYMSRQQAAMNEQVRQQRMKKLKQIRDNQIMAGAGNQPVHMPQNMMPPPVYPGGMVAGPGMTMTNYGPMRKQQQFQALQQHHLQQQRRLQFMRMQQQQQQQMHQQQMMSQQYGYQTQAAPPGIHATMRPMQANPPIQMQQVIQQSRQYPAMMAPAGMPPGRQPGGMQYPPQQAPPGMNQVMGGPRPGTMF